MIFFLKGEEVLLTENLLWGVSTYGTVGILNVTLVTII